MATLLTLAAQGWFTKLDPVLRPDQQEMRLLYALPRARTWLETTLPTLSTVFEREDSPAEQVDALLAAYCAGDVLAFGRQFHPLRHIDSGVWELKTPDVRLFGWFYRRDCFLCSNGDDATRVKRHHLYAGYRDEAVRERNKVPFEEPKFISGEDPNDVISNFC